MKNRWIVALLVCLLAGHAASCPIEDRWWEAEALRKTLGVPESAAQTFRHSHGSDTQAPEYAYATALIRSATGRVVRRGAVVLKVGAVLTFEMANGPADRPALNVRSCGTALARGPIESLDLVGARVADRVVLFHADTRSATSAVSFDVAGPARLKFLIVGLGVGTWEIWHNGFLMDPAGAVEPGSGVLCFDGAPGGYFLRRIG